jgi:TPR repeat protein
MKSAQFLIESRLAEAARGDAQACYELGIAYSCGTGGVEIDLIEAHKWLNLAALAGSEEGQAMRAEVAEEMTARERSEERRVGKECRRLCRSRWSPYH